MEVKIAKSAGFCFGVKRAMKMAFDEIEKNNKNIYALGPLIHNKQAVAKYEDMGLKTVDEITNVPSDNYMIIRSHGVGEDVYKEANDKGIHIVDTTCPFVTKIHHIVKEASENGCEVIVIGDKKHPEVIGINGWCNNKALVIKTIDEIDNIKFNTSKKYCVVSQTTINVTLFNEIVEKLSKQIDLLELNNTICSATKVRQQSAKELSQDVDCMVVIGGKHSSNTQKLVNICSELVPTFAIETKDEINESDLLKYSTIGVTAGASTPDWIIDDVINFINSIK